MVRDSSRYWRVGKLRYLILMGAEPFLVMPLLIYGTQQKIKGQIHT